MTDLEKQVIQVINQNKYLSDLQKKQYILTVFMMNEVELKEYLHTLMNFQSRCDEMDSGTFKVHQSESVDMMKAYNQVKEKFIKKYKNNN